MRRHARRELLVTVALSLTALRPLFLVLAAFFAGVLVLGEQGLGRSVLDTVAFAVLMVALGPLAWLGTAARPAGVRKTAARWVLALAWGAGVTLAFIGALVLLGLDDVRWR